MKQCHYCGERYHENDTDAIQHICAPEEAALVKPKKTDDEMAEAMSQAFHEAINYIGSWDGPDYPFKNSIRLGMRDALAVVREEES